MIVNLFPQPVGRYRLDRPFTKKEINFIKSLDVKANKGNFISVDQEVLAYKELSVIRQSLQSFLDDYLETIYSPYRETKLEFTQSWTNVTKKEQYHHEHIHHNSFISGVLYIKADGSKDRIYFSRFNDYQTLKIYPKLWNEWNCTSWWLDVSDGDVVIFPSYLPHFVEQVETDERISLSFNTFPIGMLGNPDSSNSVEIKSVGSGFVK